MARLFKVTIITLLISMNALAQNATIKGIIKDAKTGEALIGASVFIEENQSLGTMSDYDGSYYFEVPAGTYTVVCSYISYNDFTLPNVTLTAGSTKVVDFNMETAAVTVEKVSVVAKRNEESEIATISEQKKATVMETKMGSDELSRKGASTVAAGVKKVSGVSMIGSKQLFVRGLGDRYNQTLLNDMPIASPDPSKKIIDLTLFPADVVKSIGVSKVYSVTNYADYSGALISINTKDYPKKPFLRVQAGVGINNQTTFYEFQQANSVGNGFWGLNAKQRSKVLPDEYKLVNRNLTSKGTGEDPFSTDFGFSNSNALPAVNTSISGGKLFNLPASRLGVLFTSTFGNQYVYEKDLLTSELKADGTIKNTFFKDVYTYETKFTNLLSVAHIGSSGSIIKLNVFQTLGTDDAVEIKDRGWSNEGDSLYVRNSEFVSNNLWYYQLIGTHSLTDAWDFNWKVAYSQASSRTPDRRQVTYEKQNENWTLFALNLQESLRLFVDQEEDIISSDVGATYNLDASKGKLSFGAQGLHKSKVYDSYVYFYDVKGLDSEVTDPTDPTSIFTDVNFENDKVFVRNGSSYPMKFDGTLLLVGTYADLVYNYTEKLLLNVGLRYEYSDLLVNGYSQANNQQQTELSGHDLFPALNIKYAKSEKENIRFAASRTITRPSFYETSPASIVPKFGEPKTQGNSELQNAYNLNVDVKYELFPKKTDLISFAVYGKALNNPIEIVAKPTGGSILYTFKNTEKGYAGGVEFEAKKFLNESLFVGCNASYIYTYISIPENANETEKTRAMQGASPYLINADLGYQVKYGKEEKNISSVALVYNVYGKRLYAVGTDGMGSVFELPYHTLNIIVKNKLNESLSVNFKVENILNQSSQFAQGVNYNNNTKEYERLEVLKVYKKGINGSVSLSYTFN